MKKCIVCEAEQSHNDKFIAKEMMLGLREEFEYTQCSACLSLQISEVPGQQELNRFYPTTYYSLGMKPTRQITRLEKLLLAALMRHVMLGWNPVGGMLSLYKRPAFLDLLRKANAKPSDRFLDVGSGDGGLLDKMAAMGLVDSVGIDPFLEHDLVTSNGAKILKRHLAEVQGHYDVIMFNHSLEHIPDPVAHLRMAKELLSPSGVCIVRIPTTSSDVWEAYRENWVELDPPRHLFVPSRSGMEEMGRSADLRLERVIDDTSAFERWGSELYARGISLRASSDAGRRKAAFTKKEYSNFVKLASDANRRGRGGRAAFLFRAK